MRLLWFSIGIFLIILHLHYIICTSVDTSAYESVSGTCDTNKYAMKIFETCNMDKDCKSYMRCNNGTCVDAVDGSHCSFDKDCIQKGYFCIDNKCTYRSYSGEACKKNTECYTNLCNLRTRLCEGQPLGASCNATNLIECDKDLYCSTKSNTCVKKQEVGDTCLVNESNKAPGSNWNVACKGGSICINQKCVVVHTKKEKERASSPYDCTMATHYKNGVCVHNMNPYNGARVECKDGSSADYTEHCVCQDDGQVSVRPVVSHQCTTNDLSQIYTLSTNDFTSCWRKNDCPYSEFEDSLKYLDFYIPNNRSCMSKCRESALFLMCCLQFDTTVYSDSYSPSYVPFRHRAECIAKLQEIAPNMNAIFTRILFLVSVTSAVTMVICLAFVFLIQRGTRLANAARMRQLQQQQQEGGTNENEEEETNE